MIKPADPGALEFRSAKPGTRPRGPRIKGAAETGGTSGKTEDKGTPISRPSRRVTKGKAGGQRRRAGNSGGRPEKRPPPPAVHEKPGANGVYCSHRAAVLKGLTRELFRNFSF
jgi:hypothetical protein